MYMHLGTRVKLVSVKLSMLRITFALFHLASALVTEPMMNWWWFEFASGSGCYSEVLCDWSD